MSVKLTAKQKATIADCSCPLPHGLQRVQLSKKAIILPFVIFGLALYLFWALWPPAVLWLLGIYGVLLIGTLVARLIRGHSLGCALKWSPTAALYVIADGIATGLSAP